jgi:hypothetical protein
MFCFGDSSASITLAIILLILRQNSDSLMKGRKQIPTSWKPIEDLLLKMSFWIKDSCVARDEKMSLEFKEDT